MDKEDVYIGKIIKFFEDYDNKDSSLEGQIIGFIHWDMYRVEVVDEFGQSRIFETDAEHVLEDEC